MSTATARQRGVPVWSITDGSGLVTMGWTVLLLGWVTRMWGLPGLTQPCQKPSQSGSLVRGDGVMA